MAKYRPVVALLSVFLSLPQLTQAADTPPSTAAQFAAQFIEASPVPGGIALVNLGPQNADDTLPIVSWNDKHIAVVNEANGVLAIVGIPLSTGQGQQSLRVVDQNGLARQVPFMVKDMHYEEQRLTISNKRKVNPNPIDVQRINRENKRLKEVKSYHAERLLTQSFAWPLAGPVTSPFGLKRFYNDQPRRPHGGIDIAADEGTPILAPADGIVIEAGDYFFNGNCVFIEHGLGLQTFYAHMSQIDVQPGDFVSKGQRLGAVGQTGRVTGPHLHWSVGLNGTWVNPLLVLTTDTPPLK